MTLVVQSAKNCVVGVGLATASKARPRQAAKVNRPVFVSLLIAPSRRSCRSNNTVCCNLLADWFVYAQVRETRGIDHEIDRRRDGGTIALQRLRD